MAIGNEELMHEYFPKHLRMGTAKTKDTQGKKTSVNQRLQIDFSVDYDRVNHQGILYRLCSVGIGGSVLSILTQFLSNRSQHVMVDGCRSKPVDTVRGVQQGVFWAGALRSFFPFWKIS